MAVKRFDGSRAPSRAGQLEPAAGTVFLIQANPEGTSQGRRHTPEGDDLNRLWDFEFTETLRQEAWGYEHHRVLELREVLGELDVFLDLHSAATPTPPFGVSNGEASIDDIAKQVGISFLVQSWYGLADKVIIGFLKLAGIPALSVECGSHDDPEITDKAHRIAMNFLRVTGAIDDGHETNGNEVRTVHVVETITKPSRLRRPMERRVRLRRRSRRRRDLLSSGHLEKGVRRHNCEPGCPTTGPMSRRALSGLLEIYTHLCKSAR